MRAVAVVKCYAFRLRVRAQWYRKPVHDVRPARALAPHEGHRPPHCRGLCSRPERLAAMPRPSSWSRTISTSTARLPLSLGIVWPHVDGQHVLHTCYECAVRLGGMTQHWRRCASSVCVMRVSSLRISGGWARSKTKGNFLFSTLYA